MNGDVQFKEEWRPQRFVPQKGWGEKLAGLIVKYSGGLIKDETQASYVILGFVGLSLIIIIVLLSNVFSSSSEPPTGFRGNIPNTPEYQNPPRPEDLR